MNTADAGSRHRKHQLTRRRKESERSKHEVGSPQHPNPTTHLPSPPLGTCHSVTCTEDANPPIPGTCWYRYPHTGKVTYQYLMSGLVWLVSCLIPYQYLVWSKPIPVPNKRSDRVLVPGGRSGRVPVPGKWSGRVPVPSKWSGRVPESS